MNNKCGCKKPQRKKGFCGNYREIKRIGFIMLVFGIVTLCAFFFPVGAWIVLLGGVLIYCGLKLIK